MNFDLAYIKVCNPDKAVEAPLRKSSQFLMPVKLSESSIEKGEYNIYPVCSLEDNKIFTGYYSLARWIIEQKTVVIDGYTGVFWDKVQSALNQYFLNTGLTVNWVKTEHFLKPLSATEELVQPFLGDYDSVWGTKCSLTLKDFYEVGKLTQQSPDNEYDINIVIGTAAVLSDWHVPVIYIDLPKNELQFRMRAGSITNLGNNNANEPFYKYKRFYFVDWVLLNKHKKAILDKICIIADGQWPDDTNWMFRTDFVEGLNKISHSVIRVRPWFEPGAWGGQWIKDNIRNLNKDVVNYAWSFELIVPENGLVFESNGYLLEVSFDFLMFHNQREVLGRDAYRFGDEFPIRFDFLDTFDGGNLSVQCHPGLKYIQEVFGETITQDETYYILDCKDKARVYLGFQDDIDPGEFKEALQTSRDTGIGLNIENYVQSHPVQKHDLFLIPNSTIHSAGAGNLVLEISATPYIFTFKMYDWLRLDLEGNPRPINIEHAFNNLNFDRKGDQVQQKLISKPYSLEKNNQYELIHLPTHSEHFYDVHRIEFSNEAKITTEGKCHVLMLVEGTSILVQTANGVLQRFNYAETFIVPAAAQSYQLKNEGEGIVKVIKAFIK